MKNENNIYNPKHLKKKINNYGYKYSYLNLLFETFLIMTGIIAIAYLYGLQKNYILVISFSLMAMIPTIIVGWFTNLYNLKRFDELSDYLTNAIPLFICKPKINYVLKEIEQLTSGHINKLINKSIKYINETVDDPCLFENGLKIISNEYLNTRVISLHKFLISVEKADSSNYRTIADTLYKDIETWIKRVRSYQKELIDKRNKLILLSFSTLIINSVFVYIYKKQSFFEGFVENEVYQISTTIFIILISLIITVTINKLSGIWLINDTDIKNEKELIKAYDAYRKNDYKLKTIDKIIVVALLLAGLYLYYIKLKTYSYLVFIVALIVAIIRKLDFINKKKTLDNYFKINFPLWIREISLLVGNLTVLNAIEESINNQEKPMKNEIRRLLINALKNPTSIKPYNDFLDVYKVDNAKSSMRILFSLNGTDNQNVKERLALLSERNQEDLAKSESIKNKNSMFLIDMIAFVPTILFTMQTIISMAVMFKYVIEKLGVDLYL